MAFDNSTTIYKIIPDYPSYRIGDDGSIWSHSKGKNKWKLLRQAKNRTGHLVVTVRTGPKCPVQRLVHRLVLFAFVGPCPDGMQCCHYDGNPANNLLGNLRWDTPGNNSLDKHRHGTRNTGERHGNSKLTAATVISMRTEYALGLTTYSDLANKHSVSLATVCDAVLRKTWKHI